MWATVLLLVVSSHVFAQEPAVGAYEAALDRAEQLFGKGYLDGVIQELKPWVERDMSLAAAQHGLGLAYYQKPDFVRAIRHLSAALPLEPENSPQWKQTVEILAMAYYFSNRAQDALPLLEKAVAWAQGDTNISYTLAMAYLATHDGPNTRRSFAKLFGIDAESPQAYVLAADLMSQENYVDAAEAMISAALEKQPDLPLVSYKLGLIALTRGRFEQAAEHFRKELVPTPGTPTPGIISVTSTSGWEDSMKRSSRCREPFGSTCGPLGPTCFWQTCILSRSATSWPRTH